MLIRKKWVGPGLRNESTEGSFSIRQVLQQQLLLLLQLDFNNVLAALQILDQLCGWACAAFESTLVQPAQIGESGMLFPTTFSTREKRTGDPPFGHSRQRMKHRLFVLPAPL